MPKIGDMPINEITSGLILNLCRKIEEQGILETALRVKQVIGQIFRYAIATNRTDYDPTVALAGALQSRQRKHMAAIIKPSDIAMLMKNINVYPNAITRCALKFSALIFCRPGEVRHAEWSEADFDNAEWRVPAVRVYIINASKIIASCITEINILSSLS